MASVTRGFKMPDLDHARLSGAEVSSKGLRLRFSAGGLPPPSAPDDELLLFLTFNLAHHGGDQDHAGIGIEPFVIDEADFLVLGLLVLHA